MKCTRCKNFIFLNFDNSRTICTDCERSDKINSGDLVVMEFETINLTDENKVLIFKKLRDIEWVLTYENQFFKSHGVWQKDAISVCDKCGLVHAYINAPEVCECGCEKFSIKGSDCPVCKNTGYTDDQYIGDQADKCSNCMPTVEPTKWICRCGLKYDDVLNLPYRCDGCGIQIL